MSGINFTPLAHLTDEELLREVYTKPDVTDHELELSERLDRALVMLQTYTEELGSVVCDTKYVETA